MTVEELQSVIVYLQDKIEKLEAIGGLKSIVPSEGIVFKYKGKKYFNVISGLSWSSNIISSSSRPCMPPWSLTNLK